MENYIIWICILVVAILAAAVIVIIRKRKMASEKETNRFGLQTRMGSKLVQSEKYEMTIKFDNLPALTEKEENALVEVKDKSLLARIDNAVPGTLQIVANTGAVKNFKESTEAMGQLYQCIIPKGAVLDQSRAMEGAVRGSYREVANSIKGQANWVAVDNGAANKLAALNVTNAAMSVASMVVGQYYMSQINDQLEGISDGISRIAGFQDNEYKSKVYALVAEVQKCSTFQLETMENNELRNRELAHLKNLEHECAQLLGQANLAIQGFTKNKGVDYSKYEQMVSEVNTWYQYQQILLEVMYKISDLTYALNLGAISHENSYAMYLPYAKQADDALKQLASWHEDNGLKLEIDLESSRRRRQGIGGFFMNIPALFDDDLHYKAIPKSTVKMINKQSGENQIHTPLNDNDLFQEDVRLVTKEGKLYYLPEKRTENE